jgi:hypothetical protein
MMIDYPSSPNVPLSSPFPSDSIATATIDSTALLKNYRPSSTLPLPSLLFTSCATATATATATVTATIDSPEILKKTPSESPRSLCSRLFPSDTTAAITAAIDSPALQQRKISIRFSPMVSVKRTISRHSMTQQEKSNCWLQEYEFLMIKQRNHMIIKQIHQERNCMMIKQVDELGQCLLDNTNDSVHGRHHSNNTKSSFCFRGLEWGMEFESLRKKSFRYGALEEVFIEQEAQNLGDYYDDEAIAYAYYSVSSECQYRAERVAIQDRKEIEDYIMYNDCETTSPFRMNGNQHNKNNPKVRIN